MAFASGVYPAPSKMWYYSKQLFKVPSLILTSYDYVQALQISFRLPRQMKELVISFTIPGINFVTNTATGNYPGYEISLAYENTVIDESLFTVNESVVGRSITRTVLLEGTIYNASAGAHSINVKIRSTNGNVVNFYFVETISKQLMKINVNMVGYAGSD